ncbi:glycosyltransferase family 2 protein [Butyricimonas paravirosa]|uniref:glycosyltransferase family 2 protein n=1 Tax=Butyricimonas paravirosa TaxID=1472417 RepID=UPI00210941FE|nr:glycosyltransferase family A protein [Butyricimonas paravirosa]MCQ4872554.1 glycosyltransferase [Butyricimonas paravirosa]
MDKISIIIPVYNLASYIRRCLESVIKQTYKELDIIVINDGSKDNSLEILKEYASKDSRIRIIDKKNGGVTSCRRVGLEQVQGEYVFFLDGDDWLEIETLSRLYSCSQRNKADIVLGNVFYSSDVSDKPLLSHSFDTISSREFIHQLAHGKQLWSLCMKLIKTSICRKMIIPDDLSMAEDMAGMLQLAYFARIVAKDEYYGYHYYQRQGASTKTPTLKHAKDALLAAKYVTDFLKRHDSFEEYIEEIAWINLRCLLTSCNQGGVSRNDPLVEQIYKQYYCTKYLSIFSWSHRLILFGYKKGINLYKLLFLYRKWRTAIIEMQEKDRLKMIL